VFGSLRFILAGFVAAGHAGFSFGGWNPGISAVTIFYILSGYVMTHTIKNHFYGLGKQQVAFYKDRILRLFPQYLGYMLLAALFVTVTSRKEPFLTDEMNVSNFLINLLVIPLNYFQFNKSIEQFMLIPPAWSLGLEMQFYLILPFVLLVKRLRLWTLILSLAIFTVASFNLLDSDAYTFRLLPGTLFIFLTGSLIYDVVHGRNDLRVWLWILCGYVVIVAGFIFVPGKRVMHEVYIGYLLGVPIVLWLSLFNARNHMDVLLGSISYGLFLSHFFVIWFGHYCLDRIQYVPSEVLFGGVVLAVSVVMAYLSYLLLERPIVSLRLRLRSSNACRNGKGA